MSAARPRRRQLLGAALLVVVVSAVLALALGSRHGTGSGGSPATTSRAAAPAQTPGPAAPSLPRVDLAELRWTGYHGVELPSAPAAGPRDIVGGLASGYSDTPLGALVAAVNIAVRANAQWGPGIYIPTIRDQVTGPDAAALLASCQSAYSQASQAAHVSDGQAVGNAYVIEQAFRWVAYTPSDATIDLVSAGPGSQGVTVLATTRIEVVWSGGDWRVVAPPEGDWGNAAAPLSSLSGYTIFPGQG